MMTRIPAFLAAASLLLSVPALAGDFSDPQPDPNTIYVKHLTYGGSGCPGGSAVARIADDGLAFTVIYDKFIASFGPHVPLVESRKNCQLNITLHIPNGFTYAIASVDYRGYLNLPYGSSGLQKATYYFQGQAPQTSTWRSFYGETDEDWHLRDEVEAAALVWAPCGVERALNINAQVRLERGHAHSSTSGMMTMDSTDGNLETIYHITLRPCPRT